MKNEDTWKFAHAYCSKLWWTLGWILLPVPISVQLLAPGEDVWFASKNGKTYGARGTSFATGYVSAAAAYILEQNPSCPPQQVCQALYDAADDIEDPGWDAASGWGILQMP